MPFKILLLENIHQNAVKCMRDAGFEVEHMTHTLPTEELKAKVADVNVIGVRSATQLTAEVIAAAKCLLAVGCFCIGTNQVDLTACRLRGVPVFNSPFSNSRSVAELIIALVVSLSRFIGDHNTRMHSKEWFKFAKNSHEVRGQTIGVVGYGHVGSQVSVLAESMGMNVLFYDILPKMPLGSANVCQTLDELLANSDFVTLHVPDTPATKGMIGEEQISKMKKGAYLLNYSRGTVVDVEAAAKALKSGHLMGGAFDVFPNEPRVKKAEFTSALQGCPNTILTPHIGGSTEEAQSSIGFEVGHKLNKFLKNGTTLGAVNFPQVQLDKGKNTRRIINCHKNTPGVLRSLNQLLGNVNVVSQVLRTMDEVGFLIVDVEGPGATALKNEIFDMETSFKTRLLD